MNPWLTFLATQAAEMDGDTVVRFTAENQNPAAPCFISPLTDRALIRLTGPDTDKLLQGQLTCDIEALTADNPLSGSLCTPKGRMISTLQLLRDDDGSVVMITRRDRLADTLATLKKYAVFYKTQLEDISEQYCAIGLSGEIASCPAESKRIALTDTLALLVIPAEQAPSCWQQMTSRCTPAGIHRWRLETIRQGLGEVSAETGEEFIPQMLNLQHTGGVSFRKGCYTGQEIVARMQYLGKLKRRMYRLAIQASTPPAMGTDIRLPDGNQNQGHIVVAEKAGQGTVEALAVLTGEAAQAGSLTIGDQTLPVTLLPLPYDNQFVTTE